jgi:8-amino-7-oxononanoate synthase
MDDALYFSTGYMANIGVMPALVGRGDAIFADKVNHASLVDGALLSRAELIRYPHCDLAALEARLAASTPRASSSSPTACSAWTATSPRCPSSWPWPKPTRPGCWWTTPTASACSAPRGAAASPTSGCSPRLIYMGTLGKAAGVSGAFVAGHRSVIEWLVNTSRSYIFTTGAPPLLAETLLTALDLIEHGDARRAHLAALIARFKAGLTPRRWQLLPSDTPIQPLVIGDNHEALAVSRALDAEGLWVPAIRPPTVPKGAARLRITCRRRTALNRWIASSPPSSAWRPAPMTRPLVLLHGWGLSSKVWAPLQAAAGRNGARPPRPRQRAPAGDSLAAWAEALSPSCPTVRCWSAGRWARSSRCTSPRSTHKAPAWC